MGKIAIPRDLQIPHHQYKSGWQQNTFTALPGPSLPCPNKCELDVQKSTLLKVSLCHHTDVATLDSHMYHSDTETDGWHTILITHPVEGVNMRRWMLVLLERQS